MLHRKVEIFVVNSLILIWLFKVVFFDEESDVVGMFAISTLLFMVIYNAYMLVLFKVYFKSQKLFIEIGFFFLLLLPIFILLYYSKL